MHKRGRHTSVGGFQAARKVRFQRRLPINTAIYFALPAVTVHDEMHLSMSPTVFPPLFLPLLSLLTIAELL